MFGQYEYEHVAISRFYKHTLLHAWTQSFKTNFKVNKDHAPGACHRRWSKFVYPASGN